MTSEIAKRMTSDVHEQKMIEEKIILTMRIRHRMKELGVSQSEFAELAKTSQPKISNIVNGKIFNMTIDWLMVVASRVGA